MDSIIWDPSNRAPLSLQTSAADRDTDDEGIEPDHVDDHATTPRGQNSR